MKTQKQFKIAGIIVMSLGIIHLCATPVVIPISHIFNAKNLLTFTFMFVFTGIATVFTGWLQYFIMKKLNNDRAFLTILRATVLLLSISGIGAVATMWNNPFAYIILFVALYESVLLKITVKST